jgi:hypothetical protein
MARQVGLCVAVTLALVGLVLGLLFTSFIGVLSGALGGATLGAVYAHEAIRRDARVRKLAVTALGCDANVVNAKTLAEVLGTPDVLQARTEHLRREATVLAQRYANGDASDY